MHESLRGNAVAGSTLEALIFAIMLCLRWPERVSLVCRLEIGGGEKKRKMRKNGFAQPKVWAGQAYDFLLVPNLIGLR